MYCAVGAGDCVYCLSSSGCCGNHRM